MKLQFRGDRILVGKAMHGKAELLLGLLLGRFGDEVGRVTLRLSKAKDADRQSDKRCEIVVELKPLGVRVEHTDPDLSVAVERAADKAVRSISRALDREREANPAKSRAALRVLETARVKAADRVLATARARKTPWTRDYARGLATARVIASDRVLATALALKAPSTPESARLLESARVLAAKRVLATARAVARQESGALRKHGW